MEIVPHVNGIIDTGNEHSIVPTKKNAGRISMAAK